jgi:hypothetical protein
MNERRWKTGIAGFLLLLGGCEALSSGAQTAAVFEIEGGGSGQWGDAAANANFTWQYETVAWSGRAASPIHRMRTEVRAVYDPDRGEVLAVRVTSSGEARSYRHITLTPDGDELLLRVGTLLETKFEDRTVVKIGAIKASDLGIDLGVGPSAGLAEEVRASFAEDGSFRIVPGSGAHLAGANVRVQRRMTRGPDGSDPVTESFP